MSSERIDRPDRRGFLRGSLGAAAAGALMTSCGDSKGGASSTAPADEGPGLPDGLEVEDFLMHQSAPLALEGRREHQRGLITPTDKVFVRANLPFPEATVLDDPDAWSFEITGVASPRTMTVGELKRMRPITVAAVLQCSGNGRKFFPHGASGSPWGVGAAANVLWTGVRLGDVVEALGGPQGNGLRFVNGSGGETLPEGVDESARAERSIPIEKALRDGILAWQMNGEALTLSHGGPLRLFVPGYYGVNHVKFVKRLALSADESNARMQAKSYRVRPVGESSSTEQPSMYEMNVKSWITGPLERTAAGARQVTGVAFSGGTPIDSVEVTTDGGTTWSRAELIGPDLGPFAWRTFSMPWEAKAGTHVLASRATDRDGKTQPETPEQNERGYAHNGWRDPAVTVEIA